MSDEFAFPVSLTETEDRSTVMAFHPDANAPVYYADSSHPNWTEILFGLRVGDPNVWDLFDVAGGVMNRFQQISERYAWDGHNVLFDGDPVHSSFSSLLERALRDGNADDYTAIARFGEKLAANPNDHSREQAYDWLASHRFQITPDGDVVGYKSVVGPDASGVYRSGFASKVPGKPSAFVNGKAVPPLSQVPQRLGDVVSMPRSEVVHDPNRSCERGLHVGTVNYWGGFQSGLIEVHVNPMHVCSVPTGDNGAKIRVCQYTFARVAVEPNDRAVLRHDEPAYAWAGDVGYRV